MTGRANRIFWTQQFPRWSGAAAILGGLLLGLAAFLHNLQPPGCLLGVDCGSGSMRTGTAVVGWAGSVASVLIMTGIAGLTTTARQGGRHPKLMKSAVISASSGFILLATGSVIQAIWFNGNLPWMPLFVFPGLLALIVGFVLIGIYILRSQVLPRWLAVFLLVSSIVLLAANEQFAAVLLAIPFGLAMATTGYFMLTGRTSKPSAAAESPI